MERLKVCPFCGGEAEINKNPLWHGNHGYKGCYEFVAVCKKCGCRVDHIKNDSIYRSEEEAQENVIKAWNKRVSQAQDVPDTNVGDTISRKMAIDTLGTITMYKGSIPHDTAVMKIERLPSTQPEIIRCKDCKYFELDHFARTDRFPFQIPLIVAHEVCMKWGNGCQTSADGWCFMAERRTDGSD